MKYLVNMTSEYLPTDLATSMQPKNTINSTYMDTNNIYQGLKQIK